MTIATDYTRRTCGEADRARAWPRCGRPSVPSPRLHTAHSRASRRNLALESIPAGAHGSLVSIRARSDAIRSESSRLHTGGRARRTVDDGVRAAGANDVTPMMQHRRTAERICCRLCRSGFDVFRLMIISHQTPKP
eukprot:791178-Prymnesium_polylepis.3